MVKWWNPGCGIRTWPYVDLALKDGALWNSDKNSKNTVRESVHVTSGTTICGEDNYQSLGWVFYCHSCARRLGLIW